MSVSQSVWCHHNKRHVPTRQLRPLLCVDSITPIHSASALNNAHNKTDIICLTETWQKKQDFFALNEATPPGYVYLQKPHSERGGGGLAVIHRANIPIKEVTVPATTTFEGVIFNLAGSSQLQCVLVYRPPKAPAAFLSELCELLTPVCATSPSTLLLGDFNIHVDTSSCKFASEFLSLLDCFNSVQHVQGPTHSRGHTLDLVCSTGFPLTNLQCLDLAVSDHRAIIFNVPASLPRQRPRWTIMFRNIKTVSIQAFSSLIANYWTTDSSISTPDDMVVSYNTALSLSLDSLAPLKIRTVSFTRPAPWFTTELHYMKATGRRLERLYKRTALTVPQLAFKEHVTSYKKVLSQARTRYYSTLIESQQNHPRALFSTINRLLSHRTAPHPSAGSDLCSKFHDFFQAEVDCIHQQLLVPPSTPLGSLPQDVASPATCPSFSSFTPVDATQITELVTKAKASSCSLDPMPTALVKACLRSVCPRIVNIVNASVPSSHQP